MTVARIAMSTTLMPVTVDTFETRRRHRGPKVTTATEEGSFQTSKTMTVTRMATPRGPIPVTVDTFEASGGPGRAGYHGVGGGVVGTRSADAYNPYKPSAGVALGANNGAFSTATGSADPKFDRTPA